MTQRVTGLALRQSSTGASPVQRQGKYLAADIAGTSPAEAILLVGNRQGSLLGELVAMVDGAAWKLNDYGQLRLSMAIDEYRVFEELLTPGNRIFVQFGNGLKWGGVLDLPRQWQGGIVDIVGYSAEWLAYQRITSRGRYFSDATAGQIYVALLQEYMAGEIQIGPIWYGGETHSPSYHFRQLGDIFTKSLGSRMETAEWHFEPALVNNRIVFIAHLYERRGSYRDDLAFIDGVNVARTKLQKQGPIINEWQLAGDGTGWGASARIYATAEDEDSQGQYGRRQKSEIRVDVTQQTTLDNAAANNLERTEQPRPIVSLTTIDYPPARFYEYDIGDTIPVELNDYDYRGDVRVIAREYLGRQNICAMVVE
jgi:hypothetical protein